MALWNSVGNGHLEGVSRLADLDPEKLEITLSATPKDIPNAEDLVFGKTPTDHMLIATFDPEVGWSNPEIKPYGPLSLDPASSCFHYCPNVFEGMKAYVGPDGNVRLFRPQRNMERLTRSMERVALPPVNTDALLTLIKKLVKIDSRWIPRVPGYSMYIRPTVIGTRAALGVAASDHATLYVILSPAGPYFRTGPRPLSLLAVGETVRSWPGGTGGFKLGLNYAPGFLPQRLAAKEGYDQILWLLGDDKRITEVGAMNVFVALKRDDGGVDVFTPPLDGTILPGITRASTIELLNAHSNGKLLLPNTSPDLKFHTSERIVTMSDLSTWSASGNLLEVFGVGTAVLVAPVGRIGFEGKDILLSTHVGGLGPIGHALWDRFVEIQEGRVEWDGWSVVCE